MSHHQSRSAARGSRFHGVLTVGRVSWHVHFLDVSRLGADWIIECLLEGPRVATATIRCPADARHGDTARRAMEALRNWLASGHPANEVFLEVPGGLEKAS